jgi:arylsulfatase A
MLRSPGFGGKWALLWAGMAGGGLSLPSQANGVRPNILFIITDDIGWGDFACYNPEGKIPTPFADRLAATGMLFTDAHSASGVCSPSRYSFLTGNYPFRGRKAEGVWYHHAPSMIMPRQQTTGLILGREGYRTAIFGKTGIGSVCALKDGVKDIDWSVEQKTFAEIEWSKPLAEGPCQWGFDYSYVLLQGHQAAPYLFIENGTLDGRAGDVIWHKVRAGLSKEDRDVENIMQNGPGLADWDCREVGESLLRKTESFLDRHLAANQAEGVDRPFYIHFSTAGAHSPYLLPEKIRGVPVAGVSRMTARADSVVEADAVTGGLLDLLEKRGLMADTLIVLTSDNGGQPVEKKFGHDSVGGLSGQKSSVFEGGHRVPLIIRWGDGTAAGSKIAPKTVCEQLVAVQDLVATFAELAGAESGPDQMLDSVSFADVLLGRRGEGSPVRNTFISQAHPGGPSQLDWLTKAVSVARRADGIPEDGLARSFRDGRWKLIFNVQNEAVALYNLDADRGETTNLINHPEQAERVERMVKDYRLERLSARTAPLQIGR